MSCQPAGDDVITGGLDIDAFVYVSMRDAGDSVTDCVPGTDLPIGPFSPCLDSDEM